MKINIVGINQRINFGEENEASGIQFITGIFSTTHWDEYKLSIRNMVQDQHLYKQSILKQVQLQRVMSSIESILRLMNQSVNLSSQIFQYMGLLECHALIDIESRLTNTTLSESRHATNVRRNQTFREKIMKNVIGATIINGKFQIEDMLTRCLPMIPTDLFFRFK